MLAVFVIGSTVLWTFLLVSKARDDRTLVASWFDLFQRCRTSIESRQPLFMFSLLPSSASLDPLKTIEDRKTRLWAPLGGGRFAILEREAGDQTGALRSCEVVPSDWHGSLSRLEIERLAYTFMEQRSVLLGKGSHEAFEPSPVTGSTSAGFRTTGLNPAGCPVVTAMFAEPELGKLTVVSGEQGTVCQGGPSFMKPGP